MKCRVCNLKNDETNDLKHKQLMFCTLLSTPGSMSSSGVVCANHCILLQMTLECVADLVLRSEINSDDLKKSSWINSLPKRFKDQAETIQYLTGKSYFDIRDECKACRKDLIDGSDSSKVEYTGHPMSVPR
jgi:hypothetical protein